jgi:monoamine oxidase
VIVVGAGAAGLAAGALLVRRGAAVTVVEARDRIGGRIDTREDPTLGVALEGGAEFVHGRPARTLALARQAGALVREIPERHQLRVGRRLIDATGAFSSAEELVSRTLEARPGETLADALHRVDARRRFGATQTELALEFARGFYLADPGTASARALARMTRAIEARGGDVTQRVEGGYARVLAPLVRGLRAKGAAVRLSTAVRAIRWRRGHVEVRARGATGGTLAPILGDRVVVTVPISILREGALRFHPALPRLSSAVAALAMGPIVKVLLRFRRALWESSGPRRLVFLHVPGAPVPVLWTLAPARAPVLVGWAGGPHALALAGRTEQAVLRAALRSAARGLGERPRRLEEELDAGTVVDWTRDPYARGGYAVFPAGSGGAQAELARNVEDTIFFAGEATAGDDAGTVEGAIRSGERAAREVLEFG